MATDSVDDVMAAVETIAECMDSHSCLQYFLKVFTVEPSADQVLRSLMSMCQGLAKFLDKGQITSFIMRNLIVIWQRRWKESTFLIIY